AGRDQRRLGHGDGRVPPALRHPGGGAGGPGERRHVRDHVDHDRRGVPDLGAERRGVRHAELLTSRPHPGPRPASARRGPVRPVPSGAVRGAARDRARPPPRRRPARPARIGQDGPMPADAAPASSPPAGPTPPGAGLAPADLAAAAATLRDDLAEAGFTVDGVKRVLGPVAAAALHREQAVPARRALRDRHGGPAAVLATLFLLGGEVPRRALDAALARTGTDGAHRLGLVEAAGTGDDDAVRAVVDLRPYAASDAAGPVTWWLSSDLGELATGRRIAPDHVLGAGGASLTLAQVTVRTPVGRVLDLGTGCGIQALHAARHSRAVVATDISRRALGFAAFNAALDAPAPADG